jgi:hypothetical protein
LRDNRRPIFIATLWAVAVGCFSAPVHTAAVMIYLADQPLLEPGEVQALEIFKQQLRQQGQKNSRYLPLEYLLI